MDNYNYNLKYILSIDTIKYRKEYQYEIVIIII